MRRLDSGWRDKSLGFRHAEYGFSFPLAGMQLPMVEYDAGKPVALISYLDRHDPLPRGKDTMAACRSLGSLFDAAGFQLPAFTVQYDTRNWAVRLYPHNGAARTFLDRTGWTEMTEVQFVDALFRMRGRFAPTLAPYGVDFGTESWITTEPSSDFRPTEAWPGQLMSHRRRCFEPVGQTRMSWRNPCVDIDFAVGDRDDLVSLIVDYKAPGAKVDLTSTNMKALSGLYVRRNSFLMKVPAMVARYEPGPSWTYHVHCLNREANSNLAYALGQNDDSSVQWSTAMAGVVTNEEWVTLTESQWVDVLRVAREL